MLRSGTEVVLLVEDDEAVRRLAKTFLSRAGYTVLDASDALEASRLFDEHHDSIALIVTDVVMPGSSGPALFQQLAARRPSLKVLYMSGYTDDAVAGQGRVGPGVAFLPKPFTGNRLLTKVREVLDR